MPSAWAHGCARGFDLADDKAKQILLYQSRRLAGIANLHDRAGIGANLVVHDPCIAQQNVQASISGEA